MPGRIPIGAAMSERNHAYVDSAAVRSLWNQNVFQQVVEVSARYDDVCLGSAFSDATNAQKDAALLQVPQWCWPAHLALV